MRRLANITWLALALAGPPEARAEGPLPPIEKSGLSAAIVDFVQIPPSSLGRPRARINLLAPAGDGSGRLFVNDMRGKLWVIAAGAVLPDPFLDLQQALGADFDTVGSQVGLSTFAFHPDFGNPGTQGFGKLYTAHSEVPASGTPDFTHPLPTVTHDSVLAEWSLDASDPTRIDPSSRREILRVQEPSRDHNIGQIAFDPNARRGDADYGLLYAAFGDGGGYNARLGGEIDPARVAQDRSNPFGTILRIDPLGSSTPELPTNGEYGIPESNPFAGSSDGSLGEVWAYGFRNPHRFSWDTAGEGAMLISDIGQANIEEIDLGEAGANYGWSEREGTFVVDPFDQDILLPLPDDDGLLGLTYPVAQYDHDEGRAVVGGFVYRGTLLPQLEGRYVFGDLVNGRIFTLDVDALMDGSQAVIDELTLFSGGQETTLLELLGDDFRADLRFGLDAAGEIYLLTKRDGMVRRLVPEPASALLLLGGLIGLGLLEPQPARSRGAGRRQSARRTARGAATEVQRARRPW